MKHTALPRAFLACFAAALVALVSACSPLQVNQAGAAPQLASPPVVRLDSARLNELLGGQGGLCTGKDGTVSACAIGPRPKWEVDQIKVPALVDMSQLQAGDRPDYVICRINYKPQPPKWECAEVYKGTPR